MQVKHTAAYRALQRSERLRAVKHRLLPARTTNRRIPRALGVGGLLDELERQQVNYVVLRWFDDLPRVEAGRDLDILVSDDDAEVLDGLLTRNPYRGTRTTVDLYSVTGRGDHAYKATACFPPRLAAGILDRSVRHPSGARVPSAEDHFHSLAFHAVYHKGYRSGLPVSSTEGLAFREASHDYGATLAKLAAAIGVAVVPTLRDLDDHLSDAGWRPPVDTLEKWAVSNKWLGRLLDELRA